MTALRHLTLSRNELGAAGAAALAPLQHLTTLHTLCLSSNNLEAAGATALAQWLHHLTALRSLDQSAHARPPTMSGAQAGGGGSQKGQCNHCSNKGIMKQCSKCHTWVLICLYEHSLQWGMHLVVLVCLYAHSRQWGMHLVTHTLFRFTQSRIDPHMGGVRSCYTTEGDGAYHLTDMFHQGDVLRAELSEAGLERAQESVP